MPNILSAGFRTAVSSRTRDVQPIMDITVAGVPATTLRLTTVGRAVCSPTLGYYEGRVITWGTIRRGIDLQGFGLKPMTGSVVIDDSDHALAATMLRLPGQTVTIRLASTNVTVSSDYYTAFAGVVDKVSKSGSSWEVSLRSDDSWLKTEFPKRYVTTADFPLCSPTDLNKPVPIIYGTHDASGAFGAKSGMCPALWVDTTNGWFLQAGHPLKATPRVYLNGAIQTLTTHYTINRTIINGRFYQYLDFVTPPSGSPIVTFDCDGVESTGDGTGATITNPSVMIRHMLTNWVFNAWSRPSYIGELTTYWYNPLTTPWWTAFTGAAGGPGFYLQDMGHTASRWLGDVVRSGEIELNQWAKDMGANPFWQASGKLAWLVIDQRLQGTGYYSLSRFREADDVIGGRISQTYDPTTRVRRVTSRWATSFAGGSEKFFEQLDQIDPRSPVSTNVQRDCRWNRNAPGDTVSVLTIGSRLLNRFRSVFPTMTARMQLSVLDLELGDPAQWTWIGGQSTDGTVGWGEKKWQRKVLALAEANLDLDALEVETTWLGLEDLLTSQWINYQIEEPGKTVANFLDGLAQLTVSQTGSFTRAGAKYVEDIGGQSAIKLASGASSIDRHGLLMELASDNFLLRTAFDAGLTGWTSGANGGTIATDTADLFFDPAVSAQSIRIAATGALTGNCVIAQVNAGGNFAGGGVFNVSVVHRDLPNTAGQLALFISRTSDGFFYHDVGGWTAAATPAIKFPHSGGLIARDTLRNISTPGVTTITVYVGIEQATVVAGQDHRAFYVGVEKLGYSTSMVVNTTAMVARVPDVLSRGQDGSGSYFVWPQQQGTCELQLAVAWQQINVAAGQYYVLHLKFNGTNEWAVYYDTADAKWHFKVTSGGLSYDAAAAVPTNGPGSSFVTEPFGKGLANDGFSWLILRWTGAENELDVASRTLFISVSNGDGTPSGLVTASATYVPPTTVAAQSVFEGCKADGTSQLNGWIRNLRFMPDVKPDSYVVARHRGALLT